MTTVNLDDIDLDNLPPTQFELDQLRHMKITAQNAKREQRRRRAANQVKGFDEPRPGQVLHVQLDGALTRRSRAGIRFERNVRIEVKVVSDQDYATTKAKNQAAHVVTVDGAESIFEDMALHVFEVPMGDDDLAALIQSNRDLEEVVKVERDENARLRAALAERKARMAAPDSPDGRPSRLPAAQAARAENAKASVAATQPGGGFGVDPTGESKK